MVFWLVIVSDAKAINVVSGCIGDGVIDHQELKSLYMGTPVMLNGKQHHVIYQDLSGVASFEFASKILNVSTFELENGLKRTYNGRRNLVSYVPNDLRVWEELKIRQCAIGYQLIPSVGVIISRLK